VSSRISATARSQQLPLEEETLRFSNAVVYPSSISPKTIAKVKTQFGPVSSGRIEIFFEQEGRASGA
jgi:hypothetical protein